MQSVNFEFYRRDVHPIPTLPIIHMEMIYERKVDNLHYISVSKELSIILSEFN